MGQDNKTYDARGKLVDLNSSSFTFAKNNYNKNKKVKVETSTFLKDALKRFCKNKSSVVGAIIIGFIILFCLFVPILSPYKNDLEKSRPSEIFLPPKLFDAGKGFWDGTEEREAIYNEATQTLENVNPNAIVQGSISKPYLVDGVLKAKYRYDYYLDVYGKKEMSIDLAYINKWKMEGILDYTINQSTGYIDKITIIDETRNPFVNVDDIKYPTSGNGAIEATIYYYKFLGYKTMPKFIIGTDYLGRDAFTVTFASLRNSLIVSIILAAVCFMFGLIWGAISGYCGGNIDLTMERVKEILSGIPFIVLATLIRLHLGDSVFVFALVVFSTSWIATATRTRTQFYRFKGREYVLASRTLGASNKRLIFKHILPNSIGTIITTSILLIPNIIFLESTLSYLGLGISGSLSFGFVLSQNQLSLSTYPMLVILPTFLISLLMISFNLFGNGLRDALNPSLKGSE